MEFHGRRGTRCCAAIRGRGKQGWKRAAMHRIDIPTRRHRRSKSKCWPYGGATHAGGPEKRKRGVGARGGGRKGPGAGPWERVDGGRGVRGGGGGRRRSAPPTPRSGARR